MSDNFYRRFEDEHRGTREAIQQRLQVYVPFLEQLRDTGAHGDVLDLGCGRGEWLELLRDGGFAARGVDEDAGMLEACQASGLNAMAGDAIEQLDNEQAQSLLAVTAFHLAEHLPHARLQLLFERAYRALIPGGLLILETPNPENIQVATCNFHLDPSHLKPLPPVLLAFMAGFHGFEDPQILRLQENPILRGQQAIGLLDVLGGVSPDYALVARKPGSRSAAAEAGESGHQRPALGQIGLSLTDLAQRFDDHHRRTTHRLQDEVGRMRLLWVQQDMLRQRMDSLEGSLGQLPAQAAEAREALVMARQALAHARNMEAQLQAVYGSVSWRISAPVRWVRRMLMSVGLLEPARRLRHRLGGLRRRWRAFNARTSVAPSVAVEPPGAVEATQPSAAERRAMAHFDRHTGDRVDHTP